MLNIENLSRTEKLRMMEAIGDDLAHDTVKLSSPEWHADELKRAECAYDAKRAKLESWESAKKILRDGTA